VCRTASRASPRSFPERGVISAVIFDLDGTLVQTEALKAQSYALAVAELRPGTVDEAEVVRAYDALIGRSRDEVAHALVERFGLADAARARARSLGVADPADALVAIRLRYYEAMLADRALLKRQEYPFATALLRRLKADGYPTGLTTVSHAAQALTVIDALGLRDTLDVIVTIDDVAHPKPDPEIYLVAAGRLGMPPESCLAIEDSLPGVQAAVAAGMTCVAVSNELTRDSLHAAPPLPHELIVDDPRRLDAVVTTMLTPREEMKACN
jgi:beta-phosphoglucomutase